MFFCQGSEADAEGKQAIAFDALYDLASTRPGV